MIQRAKADKLIYKKDLSESQAQCDPGTPGQGYDGSRLLDSECGKTNGTTEELGSRKQHTLAAFEMKKSENGWKLSFLGHYASYVMGTLTVLRPEKSSKCPRRSRTAVAALPREDALLTEASCVLFTENQDIKLARQNVTILDSVWRVYEVFQSRCETDKNDKL